MIILKAKVHKYIWSLSSNNNFTILLFLEFNRKEIQISQQRAIFRPHHIEMRHCAFRQLATPKVQILDIFESTMKNYPRESCQKQCNCSIKTIIV